MEKRLVFPDQSAFANKGLRKHLTRNFMLTKMTFIDTHLTEILLNKSLSRSINSIVLMVLKKLNSIQPSHLLHQQTKLIHLTKFLSSLQKVHSLIF